MNNFKKLILLATLLYIVFSSNSSKAGETPLPSVYIDGQIFKGRMIVQNGILFVSSTDLMNTIHSNFSYVNNQHYINNKVLSSDNVKLIQNEYYLYFKEAVMAAGATKAEYITQGNKIVIEFSNSKEGTLKSNETKIPDIYINGNQFTGRMFVDKGILYTSTKDLITAIDLNYTYNLAEQKHYINNKAFDSSLVKSVNNEYYLYFKEAVMAAGAKKAEYNKEENKILIEVPVKRGNVSGTVSWPGKGSGVVNISGCNVTLTDRYGVPYKTATTDTNGKFTISNIKEGDYLLKCSAPESINLSSGTKIWSLPVSIKADNTTSANLDNNNTEGKLPAVKLDNTVTKNVNQIGNNSGLLSPQQITTPSSSVLKSPQEIFTPSSSVLKSP